MNNKKPIILTETGDLHFEPIDIHLWKVTEDLYLGRPGEKQFRLPQIVINVLNDVRAAKQSPYYQIQEGGRYYVSIPKHNIKGVAFWG